MSLIKVKGSSITGALAAVDGSALTGVGGGITEADQWRVGSGFSNDASPITANWERNDTTGFSKIGTGMSESSGVFSFPSTGIYLIKYGYIVGGYGNNRNTTESLKITTDNSSYITAAEAMCSIKNVSSLTYQMASSTFIFDVTNTSTHKCRFHFTKVGDSVNYSGASGYNENFHEFIRLGDT